MASGGRRHFSRRGRKKERGSERGSIEADGEEADLAEGRSIEEGKKGLEKKCLASEND